MNPYLDNNFKDRTPEAEKLAEWLKDAIKDKPEVYAKLVADFYVHWQMNTFETPAMVEFKGVAKNIVST